MNSKTLKAILAAGFLLAANGMTATTAYAASDMTDTSEKQTLSNADSPTGIWQCPDSGLYFCDDFATGSTNNWNLLPQTENSMIPDGSFDLVNDADNYVLRYTADKSGGVIALVKPSALSMLTTADYYVEAKIRPRYNSTAANKQLYLLGRYQDGNNWYAGAMNIQNSVGSTQVEIAKMVNGELTRMQRVKTPIEQGAKDALDGQWYYLRLVLKGDTLTVYLDGDQIASTTDTSFTDTGIIGLWTSNKSFEIDDVRVGNADDLPASIVLSPRDTEYSAEVGDTPKVVEVSTRTETGENDTFTVTSSDSNVIAISTAGNQVTLTPVGSGTATVTFISGSNLVRKISATIAPQFEMPTAVYNFCNELTPASGEFNTYEDTQLKIRFDSEVTLGEGSIRIFRTSDDVMVDKISLINESDNIGYNPVRTIKTNQVRIDGNIVRITPHANTLEHGVNYYIAIAKEAFTGATLAGQVFEGIGKNSGWTFTTRINGPDTNKTTLVVNDNGHHADFRSVQGALNFIMQNVAADTPATVYIKNGIYEEPLYLYGKNNITLKGENRRRTIIRYTINESMNSGTAGRPLFLIEQADMVRLDNLTLKNTTLIGEGHQAETLFFNSPDGRLIATNADFFSEQDTLNLKGWTWFYNTLVAGNVDFIWGYSKVSLFENSEIRTLGDSRGNGSGGYVLQARVENETDKGFVFLNSKITRGNGPNGDPVLDNTTYLARSGGCSGCYDNIVFVNTYMDAHIKPVGWLNDPLPTPQIANENAGWREYNTMDLNGQEQDLSERLETLSYEMNEEEVLNGYSTREQIFSAYNNGEGWEPMKDIYNHWPRFK
ncbi:pectinesterase family protein [Gynuella sunshinyii]|uniref:Pectin methylesterase n=1 Tax=Gynuella sunshinyii YC6258 TaxID=1445510 RepID=A0A0C5UYY6_9GAMM|nr:pectinesterase family protein [Gynuella sunshinyii]AJQ92545.1 pectin methylesterase [Gynuella sunshinyii YC6258]